MKISFFIFCLLNVVANSDVRDFISSKVTIDHGNKL